MIFIHAASIHNTQPQTEQPELKSELKALSGKVYRRIDHFIQLAIIGAHKAVGERELPKETAIYMTSGQGNISVFQRVREQRHIHKLLPKPVDFINLLSNSAGFYVASHLGLSGKNLFLNHHRFPVQMTLLAAWNDLNLQKQQAVLVGGIDEWTERQELARKLLGVSEQTQLGEGSNWALFSKDPKGAIGRFVLEPRVLERSSVEAQITALEEGSRIAFSRRFAKDEIAQMLALNPGCTRYGYETDCGYYETLPMYVLNRFLDEEEGKLLHVDVSDGRYMIMSVDNAKGEK